MVKGSPLDDDYFSMERNEFTMMIYRCRNDTVMLHCIFECFVKRDKDAMAAVAKDFVYYLKKQWSPLNEATKIFKMRRWS